MKPHLRAVAAAVLVAAWAAPPAEAHHSFSMYDQAKIVTLRGVVKSFQWTNPHARVYVEGVLAAGAAPELWSIELSTSPGNLARMGWSKRSLAPGDRVAVDMNPLRDGRRGGSLKKATLTDSGKVLTTTPVAGQVDFKSPAT